MIAAVSRFTVRRDETRFRTNFSAIAASGIYAVRFVTDEALDTAGSRAYGEMCLSLSWDLHLQHRKHHQRNWVPCWEELAATAIQVERYLEKVLEQEKAYGIA